MATEVAIVTGGGSGIGRAIAHRLARDGMAVVVNDWATDRARNVAAEIESCGGRVSAVGGDVSKEDDVTAIRDHTAAVFGECTVMVNNAGHVHQARFVDLQTGDFDHMVAVHLRGTFLCARAVLPAMLERGSGSIINIASQLGQIGGVELVHYSAANAGIIGLTKALAREVSSQGVRVNAVAPGPINTPLVMSLSEGWRSEKASQLPLGRFGEPDEVADVVAFLASSRASLFVGQTLGPNSGDVML